MKINTSVGFYTADNRDWQVATTVYTGTPATRWEPAENAEVEFGDVTQDLGDNFMGPRLTYDFDNFVEAYRLTEGKIRDIEDEAVEQAEELFEVCFDEDRPEDLGDYWDDL